MRGAYEVMKFDRVELNGQLNEPSKIITKLMMAQGIKSIETHTHTFYEYKFFVCVCVYAL